MKKYVSRATRWLGIVALICGIVFLAGIILIFLEIQTAAIAMITSGVVLGILFFSCFLAEKSRGLIIDNEKIIFPRGAEKNGKMVLQKIVVRFCDISSVDTKLYKGNGLVSKDASFYTIKLKDETKITVTLYAYGKEAEKEILEAIKRSIA